ADRVLRERPTVLAGARPIGVGHLGDHLAALLNGVENGADVELQAERRLDADLDVVKVDEDRDVQTIVLGQRQSLCSGRLCSQDRASPAAAGERTGARWNRRLTFCTRPERGSCDRLTTELAPKETGGPSRRKAHERRRSPAVRGAPGPSRTCAADERTVAGRAVSSIVAYPPKSC